jgi:hypothetical protein
MRLRVDGVRLRQPTRRTERVGSATTKVATPALDQALRNLTAGVIAGLERLGPHRLAAALATLVEVFQLQFPTAQHTRADICAPAVLHTDFALLVG